MTDIPDRFLLFPARIAAVALTGALAFACVNNFEDDVGSSSAALSGDRLYSSCSASHQGFLETSMFYGRVATASTAFEQCLVRELRLYTPCTTDPAQVAADGLA